MKTKELIEELKKADPSGELEAVVQTPEGWSDIYVVDNIEGYYDGPYQVLVHDPKLKGHMYSVIGGQVRTDGRKVTLQPHSIQDAMLDNPDLPVEIFDDQHHDERLKEVAGWRKHVKQMIKIQLGQEILKKFEVQLIAEGHKGEFVCIDVERGVVASVDKSGYGAIEKAKAKENKSYYMANVGL